MKMFKYIKISIFITWTDEIESIKSKLIFYPYRKYLNIAFGQEFRFQGSFCELGHTHCWNFKDMIMVETDMIMVKTDKKLSIFTRNV